jgi:hypothetical protein
MCCDRPDSLASVRAFSDVLARVDNKMLTLRRFPRISRRLRIPHLQAHFDAGQGSNLRPWDGRD